MKTVYKHIQFNFVNERWYCYSLDGKTDLGMVYFDIQWKCYVWEQTYDVKFDKCCLEDVVSFMNQLK